MKTKEELFDSFLQAYTELSSNKKYIGTYHITLGQLDDENVYAFCLAYAGDEPDTIVTKFAYQPKNSIMQCDYDIDWLIPYDKDTGDLYYDELILSRDETKKYVQYIFDTLYTYYLDYVIELKRKSYISELAQDYIDTPHT